MVFLCKIAKRKWIVTWILQTLTNELNGNYVARNKGNAMELKRNVAISSLPLPSIHFPGSMAHSAQWDIEVT